MSISDAPPTQTASMLVEAAADKGLHVTAILERIHQTFKEDGQEGNGPYPLRLAVLSRHLLYLALSIAEPKRSGKSDRLDPPWNELVKRYKTFRKKIRTIDCLPTAITDDDLNGLCRFSTRRRGTQKNWLYSAIALFIVDQFETRQYGSDFIKFAMPQSEMNFPKEFADFLMDVVRAPSADLEDFPSRLLTTKKHEYPIINVGYAFHQHLQERFQRFFEHYVSPADGCAHFVCYRPRFSSPHDLVKSYLAIVPPIRRANIQKNSFSFVHVYRVPSMGEQRRISLGEVLPLEGGLYLVGGQRQMEEKTPRTLPFNTLKVIALPWNGITITEKILGGLVLSSNYDGKHLASRLALRATPIPRSSEIELGAIPLRLLSDNLAKDAELEQKLSTAGAREEEKYSVNPEEAGKRIVDLCNNNPTIWEAPVGYFAVTEDGSPDRHRPLIKAMVEAKLSEMFGSDENPLYMSRDAEAEIFSFWHTLQFGPVTTK